jgi:hypothetical protein
LEATAGTRPAARARVRIRFHSAIALILTGSMVVGFYFDLPKYVLHPAVHFPAILTVHSAVFVAWLFLYLTQTLLVQTGNVGLHRTLGLFGLALALIMPPLGIATAIVMRRFDLLHIPSQDVPRDLAFLAAPLADIVAFTQADAAKAGVMLELQVEPDIVVRGASAALLEILAAANRA